MSLVVFKLCIFQLHLSRQTYRIVYANPLSNTDQSHDKQFKEVFENLILNVKSNVNTKSLFYKTKTLQQRFVFKKY